MSGEHIAERVSAVEVDIRHLQESLTSLSREQTQGFEEIRRALDSNKQPVTAYAGLGAVILSLVYAFGAPLHSADVRLQERVDLLDAKALVDAQIRGEYKERFETVTEQVRSAIVNRKDQDSKHVAQQEDLRRQILALGKDLQRQINSVEHSLDNGLGRRIDEKLAPLHERINCRDSSVNIAGEGL